MGYGRYGQHPSFIPAPASLRSAILIGHVTRESPTLASCSSGGHVSGPPRARSLLNLGNVLEALGDHAGAEPLYTEALELLRAAGWGEHPTAAKLHASLGILLTNTQRFEAAAAQLQRSITIREQVFGQASPETATAYATLAEIQLRLGDHAGARAHLERAVELLEAALGPQHPALGTALEVLGRVHLAMDETDVARTLIARALAILENSNEAQSPSLFASLVNLARAEGRSGHRDRGLAHLERASTIASLRPPSAEALAELCAALVELLPPHSRSNRVRRLCERGAQICAEAGEAAAPAADELQRRVENNPT